MTIEWCRTCGGLGYVDEDEAQRIGLDLGDARTAVCPVCEGGGAAQVEALTWAKVCRLLPVGLALWFLAIGAAIGAGLTWLWIFG